MAERNCFRAIQKAAICEKVGYMSYLSILLVVAGLSALILQTVQNFIGCTILMSLLLLACGIALVYIARKDADNRFEARYSMLLALEEYILSLAKNLKDGEWKDKVSCKCGMNRYNIAMIRGRGRFANYKETYHPVIEVFFDFSDYDEALLLENSIRHEAFDIINDINKKLKLEVMLDVRRSLSTK